MKNSKNVLGVVCLVLFLSEALLFILSWLLSATRMDGVRSLLSSEGIRWFFGTWQTLFASPLLVWLLLCLIAWGCLRKSGLMRSVQSGGSKFFTFHFYLSVIVSLSASPSSSSSSTSSSWPCSR